MDKSYPEILRQSPDPPACFFVEGNPDILQTPMVAVVGTRLPTSYGVTVAQELTAALVNKAFTIVSGLAVGIDSIAQATALAKHGSTIAVLASGLGKVRPQANAQLAKDIILKNGLLLSEYLPYAHPTDYTFPERNRIIAGLSRAVIVIEAGLKSGTFITANLALEANREVLAVPGSIYSPQSVGTNRLLSQGACVCSSVDDVLQAIHNVVPVDNSFVSDVA